MKLKIAQVITKLELGGAQKNCLSIAMGLKDKYDFFIISSEGPLKTEAQGIPGVKLILLKSLKREISPLYDLLAVFTLYRIFKSHNIDIVHTHSSKAGILGRFAGRLAKVGAIVHTVHGWSFNDYQNNLTRSIYIFLEKITAKFTDVIIVVSKYDKEKGLHNDIASDKQYRLIRYGIKIDNFSGHTAIYGKKEFPVIAMIACFKKQKAHTNFLKIAGIILKEFPYARFILAGDGILREKIQKTAAELNMRGNIHFLGWHNDIEKIYRLTDVLILPSLWEGLPMVLIEAMAQGKPVVANNICANKEIVYNGINGYLVSPDDYSGFAKQVINLLKDPRDARRIGLNGKKNLPAEFTEPVMLAQLDDLYTNLTT